MDMQSIHDAARRGDYALVLRLSRIGHGWTQATLGRRANISRTAVSRFETGERLLRDVELRRRFADALDLPGEMFGLYTPPGPKVSGTSSEGEDEVRRRAFLVAAGVAALSGEGSVARAGQTSTASVESLTQRIEQALIHPERGDVLDPLTLPAVLAAAREDYRATRYLSMANRLVSLVASAEARGDERLLADVYNAIGNLLCKLPASGLEWMAVDRALRAARLVDDPLLLVEAQRLLSTVYRRSGRPDQALEVGVSAAEQLRLAGGADFAMRTAEVLCTASYSAAKAKDRDRALELLVEARRIAERAEAKGPQWTEFSGPVNVSVYAVSVGSALGDPGISFNAAQEVNVAALASTERRSRFLVDVARARLAADQPDQAARTLIVAARVAPQATATRPAAIELAGALRSVRPDLGRTLGEAGL
jgi:transcriptional regulator with XRE-family HTH domain